MTTDPHPPSGPPEAERTPVGSTAGPASAAGRLPRRRLARAGRVLVGLAGLAVLLMLVVATGLVWVNTPGGRAWLTDTIARSASDPDGLGLELEALEGSLLTGIGLRGLVLSDPEGVWLTLEDASLRWRPLALLGGRLVVDRLDVAGLTVTRPPALPDDGTAKDPQEGGLGLSDLGLLTRVSLPVLEARDIALGAAVVGRPVTLEASGGWDPRAAGGPRLALDLRRTDGQAGGLTLTATVGEAPGQGGPPQGRQSDTPAAEGPWLAVSLRATDPAGGVLSGLMADDSLPDLALALEGEGPLSDWRGTLNASAGALARVAGPVTLGLEEARARLSLGLDWRLEPLAEAPTPLRQALGSGMDLSLRAGVAGLGGAGTSLSLDRLDASGAGWTLAAAGALAADGGIAAEASLDVGPEAPLAIIAPDLMLERARLSVSLAGSAAAPEGRARLEADTLGLRDLVAAEGLTLEAQATPRAAAPTDPGGFDLTATLSPRGLRLLAPAETGGADQGAALAALADALVGRSPRVRIAGSVTPGSALAVDLSSLEVTGERLSLDGAGRLAGESPALTEATLALRLDDLSPLGSVLGMDLAGRAEATVLVDTPLVLETLSGGATLRLEAQDLVLGPDGPLRAMTGAGPRLTARLSRTATGDLAVEDLTLGTEGLAATGAAGVTAGGDLSATLSARVTRPELLGLATDADPRLTAVVSGPLEDPSATATVAVGSLAGMVPGPPVTDLAVHLSAGTLKSGPAGVVEATLDLAGSPVDLSAPFAVDPATSRLDLWQARLGLGPAGTWGKMTVDGSVEPAGPRLEGALALDVPNLARLTPVLTALGAPPLAGGIEGRVTLTPEEAGQAADVVLRGRSLAVAAADQGGAGGRDPAVGGVSVQARVTDLFGQPEVDGRVEIGEARAGSLALDRADITAQGGLAGLDLAVSASGYLDTEGQTRPLGLNTAGRLALTEETWDLAVSALDLRLDSGRLALGRAPAHLRGAGGGSGVAVDGLDLTVTAPGGDQGALALEGRLTEGALAGRITLRDLPVAMAALAQPDLALAGRVSGRLDLGGSPQTPTVEARVSARGVRTADLPPPGVAADLSATWTRDLSAVLTFTGVGDGRVEVRATPGEGGAAALGEAPLSGRMTWRGDLARLTALAPVVGHRLAGEARADVDVAGTAVAPRLSGQVVLEGARYENLETGTVLDSITAQATVGADRDLALEARATDGGGGRVTVAGRLSLADMADPQGQIAVMASDATLVRRDDVTARLDADLTLALGRTEAVLAGSVTTRDVEIRLVGGGPGAIPDLDVVEVGGAASTALAKPSEASEQGGGSDGAGAAAPLTLDLTVSFPGRVHLRGWGADMEWGGSLAVGGTAEAPQVVGDLKALRGRVDLLGRVFTVEDSAIRFDGGRRVDPILDISAAHDTGAATAYIKVGGLASAPEIRFEADPPLPEDEVIALILFGKATGELSVVEALEVARVAAALGGIGGGGLGGGPVEQLREAAGLDVLRFGSGETGDTTVEAGTYVGDRVYVGVEQGLGGDTGRVSVEVDLLPSVTLETKAGVSGAAEAGLFWKRDY